MPTRFLYVTLIVVLCLSAVAKAQEKQQDTAFFLAGKKGLLGKIGKSLSVNNPEPAILATGAVKNDSVFRRFSGKVIREIRIEKLGFEKFVNDTTKVTRNIFSRAGDALHTSTRRQVILNNLFFVPGDTVYPYLMADNEKLLRELSYLQDARIEVKELPDNTDSVDVIIICKDVFPVGGSADLGSPTSGSFEVNDDNLIGTGNRIQFVNFFDIDRSPTYGFGFQALKRNIAGTFINVAVGYQTEAPAFNSGRREEKALYLRADLPLPSPYHVWTGGLEYAVRFTQNAYKADSIYNSDFRYNYRLFDGWVGYNVGAKQRLQENFSSRLKKFVALRAIHRQFTDVPDLYKNQYNVYYSDLVSVLGAFTIFEQDYYHTNFLYGFGRNEDVPEGFNLSFTGGLSRRGQATRPYIGFEYQRNYFSNRKNYLNYTIRAGTYFNKNLLEDISFLTSIDYFTRLRKLGNSKWFLRHFISGSITQQARTIYNEPLLLSSIYGIPLLSNENIRASTRITLNGESVFYNTWKFLGFSFAPFTFANVSYLKTIGADLHKGDIYTAIGAGARTRNENLVFGTMELRASYIPRTNGSRTTTWYIAFSTDLRFKYNSQFIRRPEFAIVN